MPCAGRGGKHREINWIVRVHLAGGLGSSPDAAHKLIELPIFRSVTGYGIDHAGTFACEPAETPARASANHRSVMEASLHASAVV
jgi:hypothetical protein